MIKLTLPNGAIKEYPDGTTLLEVSSEFKDCYTAPVVEGVFNGAGVDLQNYNLGHGRRPPCLCTQPAVFVLICNKKTAPGGAA